MTAHSIKLQNFKLGEIVNHRLLILKGLLLDESGQRIKTKPKVTVHLSHSSEKISWPSDGGSFTAMACLVDGHNYVTIETETCRETIPVVLNRRMEGPDVLPIHVIWSEDTGNLLWAADNNTSADAALRRLELTAHIVQALFSEELRIQSQKRLSFRLMPTISMKLNVSEDDAKALPPAELWALLAKELAASPLDAPGRRFLVAAAFAEPQGAGRLALIPSTLLGAIPVTLAQLPAALADKQPPPTFASPSGWTTPSRCAALASALGAAAHELGHAFDLAHSSGLMSSSFPLFSLALRPKYSPPQLSSACAALLISHANFNEPCEPSEPPTFQPTRRVIESSVGLRLVQLRDNDGSVVRSWQLSGSRHMILPLPPKQLLNKELSLFVMDVRGHISRFHIPGRNSVLKSRDPSNPRITTCGPLSDS